MRRLLARSPASVLAIGATLVLVPYELSAQSYPPDLTESEVAYARAALDSLTRDPRGPYLRIRWFCRDGTVHPPQGTPCRERGGGNQHAEMNDTAKRLGRLNLHVGTILQATEFDAFFDADHLHDRLKQYLIEHYLVEARDGWVLSRARTYRGARQAEDEEARGTQFLVRILSDPAWLRDHFWLASQLVASVPSVGLGGAESHFRIRVLASEVAELDSEFLPLRIRIHSFPSPSDVTAVERYLERPGLSPAARTRLVALRDALVRHYDRRAQAETLAEYARRLRDAPDLASGIDSLRAGMARPGEERRMLGQLADLAVDVRERAVAGTDGRRNLLLMQLQRTLLDQAAALAADRSAAPATGTRRERLRDLRPLVRVAYAGGLLSGRERDALLGRIQQLTAAGGSLSVERYRESLSYLGRALEWGPATVESALYPALERYSRVEPAARGFVDAAVRASPLLPLASSLAELTADADSLAGTFHAVLGDRPRTGLRGLNPGLAVGPLRVADEPVSGSLDPAGVYVLPATITEMTPVAGVLTRDHGNLLSHVQLLARNLGIPNASVPEHLVPTLRRSDGRTVLFAVSPGGRVVVEDTALLGAPERSLLPRSSEPGSARQRLDGSRLRLDVISPVPLADLRTGDAGIIVGPKAANLGELASVFPGRVADGIVLPFGLFRRHVDRPMPGSDRTVLEELGRARERAAQMRREGRGPEEVDRYVFGVLERVRDAIVALPWRPEIRTAVTDAVGKAFGTDLSPGIFVRSDTNVEDLPNFSGAGLNLTVHNQRSVEDILSAVRRVWTSPFTERAYLWRRRVVENWDEVYPSVILQRGVPSEKSGVVVSTGLRHGGEDALTVATGEGVGGAVDGEDAETLVVDPQGEIVLLSQARAPTRRVLDPEGGGTRVVPARRPEYLLSEEEIRRLAGAVRRWDDHGRSSGRRETWDIEFGFAGGELWLFQARPFVRFRDSETLRRLEVLDRGSRKARPGPVPLDESP